MNLERGFELAKPGDMPINDLQTLLQARRGDTSLRQALQSQIPTETLALALESEDHYLNDQFVALRDVLFTNSHPVEAQQVAFRAITFAYIAAEALHVDRDVDVHFDYFPDEIDSTRFRGAVMQAVQKYLMDRPDLNKLFLVHAHTISPNPKHVEPARMVVGYMWRSFDRAQQAAYSQAQMDSFEHELALWDNTLKDLDSPEA